MQNEPCVFVCDEFWKDVKALAKKKVVGFKIDIDINGEEISPSARINLYPHIKATAQFIIQMLKDGGFVNVCNEISDNQFVNSKGIRVYKLRRAVDRGGSSSGLRYIFCLDDKYMWLVLVRPKNECENERDLRSEICRRISHLLK